MADPVHGSIQRPRRILFVDHVAAMSGGEVALLNLVLQFRGSQYEPVVLLFSEGPLADKLRNAGIELHVAPLHGSVINSRKDDLGGGTLLRLRDVASTIAFALELSRLIDSLNVAIVHTNSLKADLIGGMAARVAGVPLVWHVRDRIADDYLPARVARAFRALSRLIPTRVIAISRAVAETLGNSNRVRIVCDGTPIAERPSPSGQGDGVPVIGLVGRIAPWKGQDVFIRAASEVHEAHPSARFQIIGSAMFGEDQYETQVRQMVQSQKLEGVIEFTGFRNDVSDAIANLAILVHASTRGEPFGQVVIEGMAAGKPVIASRGGAIPDIVLDGKTGLIVPMNDPTALAEAIMKLLRDPARAADMGAAGRRRVAECFSIQRTASGVKAVYDEILGIPSDGPARQAHTGAR